MRQMLHPDHVVDPAKGEAPPPVEPIYPLTQGLPGRTLARTILGALDTVPEAPEWLEATTVKAHDWPDFRTALEHIHRPASPEDVLPESAVPHAARLRRTVRAPMRAAPAPRSIAARSRAAPSSATGGSPTN